jgi:hypothetical protein
VTKARRIAGPFHFVKSRGSRGMSEHDGKHLSGEEVHVVVTPSPADTVSSAVRGAANRVADAYETGKKPGMPLSVLSNIAREAPLGSLLVAFLLGVAVARRR